MKTYVRVNHHKISSLILLTFFVFTILTNAPVALGQENNASTATLVIAADNSQKKFEADFVCDGIDDQQELELAIETITTINEGKIVLLEGDYSWFDTILDSPSLADNIQIEGMGKATRITLNNDVTPFKLRNKSGVTIKSLQIILALTNPQTMPIFDITAEARGEKSHYNTIEDIYVENPDEWGLASYTGIRLYASEDYPPLDAQKNPNLFRNLFRDITMVGAEYGIIIQTASNDSWMSANTFEHVTIWGFANGIEFIQPAVPEAKGANATLFMDVKLQTRNYSVTGIKIMGGSNTFLHCMIYDWKDSENWIHGPKGPAWVVTEEAIDTYIHTFNRMTVEPNDTPLIEDNSDSTRIFAKKATSIQTETVTKRLEAKSLVVHEYIEAQISNSYMGIYGNTDTKNGPAIQLYGDNSNKPGLMKFIAGYGDGSGKGIAFQNYSPRIDEEGNVENYWDTNMVIRNSGNVGLGITFPTERLHVVGNVKIDGDNGNPEVNGDLQVSGDLEVIGNIGEASSRRWKTNIQTIEDALDKVQRLRGVSYNSKLDGTAAIGVIAEEVGEVVPELVDYEENGIDAKSVAYTRLVALLIEAVKEQQQEIDALKHENDDLNNLKTKVTELEGMLTNTILGLQELDVQRNKED